MKITGNNPYRRADAARSERLRSTPRGEESGSGRASRSGGNQAATEVRLSGAAQSLQEARAPETPDAEKVERLRSLVEQGQLEIDPTRIADAMLRDER